MASLSAHSAIDPAGAYVAQATSLEQWLLIVPVAVPLIVGGCLIALRRQIRWHFAIAWLTLLGCLISNAFLVEATYYGPVAMTMGKWLPPFGITFNGDLAGALFALVTSFVMLCSLMLARLSVSIEQRRYGYFGLLLFLTAGMNGAYLTGDIFNLYVWFEVILISSFAILVLGSSRRQIEGTIKYGVLNLLGTTLFLIAVGLLYGATGSLNIADLAQIVRSNEYDTLATLIVLLFGFALGVKAAIFPVHFWLPASYHTPNVATSLIFAAIATKLAIFVLLRIMLIIFPAQFDAIASLVAIVCIATLFIGCFGALASHDIRKLFAYQVLVGVGMMLAGLVAPTVHTTIAVVTYALHSMLALAFIYILVAMIIRLAQPRLKHAENHDTIADLNQLSGHYAFSPVLAVLFFVAAANLVSFPPFPGFWAKFELVSSLLARDEITQQTILLVTAILLASLLSILAVMRVWILVFLRPRPAPDIEPALGEFSRAAHKLPFSAYQLPAAILMLTIASAGILYGPIRHILAESVVTLVRYQTYYEAVFGAAP